MYVSPPGRLRAKRNPAPSCPPSRRPSLKGGSEYNLKPKTFALQKSLNPKTFALQKSLNPKTFTQGSVSVGGS